jgi:formate/nitrite transporter
MRVVRRAVRPGIINRRELVATSGFLAPQEVSRACIQVGEGKATLPLGKMFLLGILAGVYIGFGAHLATTVGSGDWDNIGVRQLLMGAAFTVGLMLVVIPGAELFTGNNLMTVALCSGRIGLGGLLRNWVVVYLGNLVGSLVLALIIASGSGLLAGPVGGTAIKIAATKTGLVIPGLSHNWAFFFRAIGCNWLVCLAIMMAMAARDIGGKVLGIFFPIMAFVASGFEHCVANMYFIPAGILAKGFEAARAASGLAPGQLAALNWGTMWTGNLIAATLGNIVGGAIFVGMAYFYAHVKGTEAYAQ